MKEDLHPIAQILLGAAVCFAFFATLGTGCGAETVQLTPQVAETVRCKLDALSVLPSDSRMVTPYDAVDLVNRLKACQGLASDAGAP